MAWLGKETSGGHGKVWPCVVVLGVSRKGGLGGVRLGMVWPVAAGPGGFVIRFARLGTAVNT